MSRKNRSQFASKRYDNLYRYPDRPGWYYRKYSKTKRRTFVYSTGFEDEAEAYRAGVKAFDDWLGTALEAGRQKVRDIARAVLASKESKKGGKAGSTYQSAENQIMNHIIPHFGHLDPKQVTSLRWDLYDMEERKRVYHREGKKDPKTGKRVKLPYSRKALMNTRKYLLEILRRAFDEELISRVPKLKNHDKAPAPPEYIPRETMLRIIRHARRKREGVAKKRDPRHWGAATKLLAFIMWKQGPRPSEALQYRWDMIRWDEGPTGTLHIPAAITKTGRARTIPLNRKVARLLRWLEPRMRPRSAYLFPSPRNPDKPQSDYKTGWRSACRRAGVDFDMYNARDTWITDRLREGLSSTFIGRYCDNSPLMIDQKYAVALQSELGRVAG